MSYVLICFTGASKNPYKLGAHLNKQGIATHMEEITTNYYDLNKQKIEYIIKEADAVIVIWSTNAFVMDDIHLIARFSEQLENFVSVIDPPQGMFYRLKFSLYKYIYLGYFKYILYKNITDTEAIIARLNRLGVTYDAHRASSPALTALDENETATEGTIAHPILEFNIYLNKYLLKMLQIRVIKIFFAHYKRPAIPIEALANTGENKLPSEIIDNFLEKYRINLRLLLKNNQEELSRFNKIMDYIEYAKKANLTEEEKICMIECFQTGGRFEEAYNYPEKIVLWLIAMRNQQEELGAIYQRRQWKIIEALGKQFASPRPQFLAELLNSDEIIPHNIFEYIDTFEIHEKKFYNISASEINNNLRNAYIAIQNSIANQDIMYEVIRRIDRLGRIVKQIEDISESPNDSNE